MPKARLSPFAIQDIGKLLSWPQQNLGIEARRRYEMLLEQAIWDLTLNSHRAGVTSRPEFGPTRSPITLDPARIKSRRL